VSTELRAELASAAIALARGLDYLGAGTVEFLVDQDRESYAFLEINTRIQVEHPVTEQVTGIDLVREQLRIAAGLPLSFTQDEVTINGHAIECRINAEDPRHGFLPSPGRVTTWLPPRGTGVRVDSHVADGYVIPPYYDSLLGKLIVHGKDRADAVALLQRALDRFRVEGVDTTLPMHRELATQPAFRSNQINIRWLESEFLPSWLDASESPAL
jgi:acetyl-CoA carboxylase biotin carboxylase subunit